MRIMQIPLRMGLGLLVLALHGAAVGWSAEYDVVIRNGRVIDGTGNPAFFADVGVRNGKIARVGKLSGTATRVIDAKGMYVCPGFIDVHTHADEIAEMPLAENFVRMGVTTIVAGNCGSSTLDFERFFREVESTNVAVNVAALVGHNDVRREAMGGSFDRPPTAQELQRMKELVDRAMKAGALGLSTGLIYLPGVFSTTEEIIELAKVVAQYEGIYTSHMRHEDSRILKALKEVKQISREAGIRAHVSHIKLAGPTAWGRAGEVLAFLEQAREEGLDITQDQYAYTASSTSLSQLVPDFALEGGRDKLRERLADAAQKERIIAWMRESLRSKGRDDYEYAVIAQCRHNQTLNGLSIPRAAAKLRGETNLPAQIEIILEIQSRGGASGVFHGMNEEDLRTFMRHPNTMVACDSGLRKLGEGVPHPRGYGNNARVLARYVRERGVLRWEDAIRKMTSLPAGVFRFEDRGMIREGAFADVVIVDPAGVRDAATYDDPHHYPEGISHVLVNGFVVLDEGRHTSAKAGKALRYRRLE